MHTCTYSPPQECQKISQMGLYCTKFVLNTTSPEARTSSDRPSAASLHALFRVTLMKAYEARYANTA